ncbi:DUF4198 domain-containing protein [Acinetobacter haemolyticus]|uniref:DUF4198 domain-containing protein n=1 Tax=Acinetobacter haemolyticus TaxID=29430 RepID=UPI0021CD6ED7|nr:DUF4198 domain-containing protein [Acinetobacter haemolyticus]MCU4378473.1 DUF4198 domain-containing protein [Acinetobacter haemolyticus]
MRHLLTISLLSVLPVLTHAHTASPFVVPEVFDSKSDNVSFQSGITIEKFFVPSRNFKTSYQITTPNGHNQQVNAAAELKTFNIAEFNLEDEGTYRIRTLNAVGTPSKYALVDGRWLRVRTPRPMNNMPTPTTATNEQKPAAPVTQQPPRFITEDKVPAKAKTAQTTNHYIAESFVTKGKPSPIPTVSNKGFELKFISHPNELYAGEALKAVVLMNGKPVPNVEFDIFKGASNYTTNERRELPHVKTNTKGELDVKFEHAGIYLITGVYPEANSDNTKPPIAESYTYSVTVEVTE